MASTARSRSASSQCSATGVSPTPATITAVMNSVLFDSGPGDPGLLHRELPAVTNIRGVVDLCTPIDVLPGLRGQVPPIQHGLGHLDVKCIGSGAGSERNHEYAVAWGRDIQSRRQADQRCSRIGVADYRDQQTRLDLF